MFQLSLHHDLWTIELPVKQGTCSCRGRDNKAGIITGNVGAGKATAPRWTSLRFAPATPRSTSPQPDAPDSERARRAARARSVVRRCAGAGVSKMPYRIARL